MNRLKEGTCLSLIASSLVVASVVLVVMVPAPVGGVSGIDPYVTNYHFYRTANGSNYDYRFTYDICNGGTNAYTEDNWFFYVVAFNTGNNLSWKSPATVETANIAAGGCYFTGVGPPAISIWHFNDPTFYCCGDFEFVAPGVPPSTNQDDTPSNDYKTDNMHMAVMHAAQSVQVRVAVYNARGTTLTFTNTIEDLIDGWTAIPDRTSMEVTPYSVSYITLQINSPSQISAWPTLKIWSKDGGNTANQVTTYLVRSDLIYSSDACAAQVGL
jgi:hypothetical protein